MKRCAPILFSAPMVRAILAGRKTVTRRIMNPQPTGTAGKVWPDEDRWQWLSSLCRSMVDAEEASHLSPYGSRWDRLWLRETWRYHGWTEDGAPWVEYAADGEKRLCERIPDEWDERVSAAWAELSDDANMAIDGRAADRKWRPSIFLPRWASRLTLEVVSVRVERLQEIDELDALHEGVQGQAVDGVLDGKPGRYVVGSARDEFAALWDSINADRAAWASNPWVWRVEFKVVQP